MPKFRLGLVGAGRMGKTHLRALAASEIVEVVAITEAAEPVRATLSGFNGRVFSELSGMLAEVDLDGVLVVAPSGSHLDIVTQVASAGLPILCEKPCGLVAADAVAAAQIAEANAVLLQVAYWRRFVPELQRLKARIDSGALGEVYCILCYQWDQDLPMAAFRAKSGGIFVDMGVHEFDQLRWLSGQAVTRLQTTVATAASAPAVPGDVESAAALCTLSGGGTGIISLGRRHAPGDMCRVEVFGTAGVEACAFLSPETGEETFLHALMLQAEGFASWVRGGSAAGATATDAIAALELAAQASLAL
jgi:myo-inositol 2-dehydrogenase / D-chiro-inositol 1-dehydrogenase